MLSSHLPSALAAGYGLAVMANLALAAHLVLANRRQARLDIAGKVFFGTVLATIAWAASGLAEQLDAEAAAPLVVLLDITRYAGWFGFLLLLLKPQSVPVTRGGFSVLVLAGVAVLAWAAFGWAQQFLLAPLRRSAGMGGMLALAVFGLVLLEQLLRNQSEASRWNAKPVCLALGFGFVFDVYIYSEAVLFGVLDADEHAARGVVYALATPLLIVATRRDVNWVNKIQVSRTAAFYSAALLLVGAYLLFIAGVGYYVRYFGGSWGRALQLATLFAALLLLAVVLVSGSLRARLRVYLGKNFFSYRYDYRQEWLRFTSMLSATSSPQEVGTLVVRGLADMVECPAGCVWSRGLGEDAFVLTARWNMPSSTEREPVGSDFCSYMLANEWIFDIDEYRSQPRRFGGLVVPLWLSTSPTAWMVVPLIVGAELIGFVVLARPRTAVELNWEVRDLLKTAARQAAGFLAHMYATEALLEARKFDAFNRMSAFVVHDLKNIITQLSLMLKNAQRLRDNPEFQQDMLLTVESSLEKMRQMMAQLREGDRPVAGAASGVDLRAVLTRIQATASARGRQLEVEIAQAVATRGHADRLERVLGHLVQNAIDATPVGRRVWVRLTQAAGRAQIDVGDEGVGMTPEFIQNQLFRPFGSTKASGMGIGSYESHQYVKELGGRIEVDSEVGRGTLITVLLPLFDLQTRSDLQLPGAT